MLNIFQREFLPRVSYAEYCNRYESDCLSVHLSQQTYDDADQMVSKDSSGDPNFPKPGYYNVRQYTITALQMLI